MIKTGTFLLYLIRKKKIEGGNISVLREWFLSWYSQSSEVQGKALDFPKF
jgi:hypothetical protein